MRLSGAGPSGAAEICDEDETSTVEQAGVRARCRRAWTRLSRRFALSEAEAAQYLGMSRAWLKKARTARFRAAIDAPPFVKAGARRVVYRRRDLEDWVHAHVSRQLETTGLLAVRSPAPHP